MNDLTSESTLAYSELSSISSDYRSVEETHEHLVKDDTTRNVSTAEEKKTFNIGREPGGNEEHRTEREDDRGTGTFRLLVRPGLREIDSVREIERDCTSFTECVRRSIEMARVGHTEGSDKNSVVGREDVGTETTRVEESQESHEKRHDRFSDSVDEHQTCNTQSEVLVSYAVRCSTNKIQELRNVVIQQLKELRPFAVDKPQAVSVSYRPATAEAKRDPIQKQTWSSIILDGQPFLTLSYDGLDKRHMIQLKASSRLDDTRCGWDCWCDKTMAVTKEVITPLPEEMKLPSSSCNDDQPQASDYDRQEWIWAKHTERLLEKADNIHRKPKVCCLKTEDEMGLTKYDADEYNRHPHRWASLCCRHIRNRSASPNSMSTVSETTTDDEEEKDETEDEKTPSKNLPSDVVSSKSLIVQDAIINASDGSDQVDGPKNDHVVQNQKQSSGQTTTTKQQTTSSLIRRHLFPIPLCTSSPKKNKKSQFKNLSLRKKLRRSQRLMRKETDLLLLKFK